MNKSVKIKQLVKPEGDLSSFQPGNYLNELEFYETSDLVTEQDRKELAELLHYLAYLALNNNSSNWSNSEISKETTAFNALESHFSNIEEWDELDKENGINYRSLVTFLMPYYPPGCSKNA